MNYFKTPEDCVKFFEDKGRAECQMNEEGRKEIYKLLGMKYPGPFKKIKKVK
ncbi:hypothetical protein FACS1894166_06680 [Bacilli bacterium]|nr:hypothetical protein FACS1894166_06680 [Bacilli bacterium]